MEWEWTDVRDGVTYRVRTWNSGHAMATGGKIPAAGEDMIKFTPREERQPFVTKNWTGKLTELNDQELQELLDEAKERSS